MAADNHQSAPLSSAPSLPDGVLADAFPIGLLLLDGEGIVRAANLHAQRPLAQPADALVGRPITAALPATTRRGDRPLGMATAPCAWA